MNEIVFVTHNKGKIASANKMMKNVNFKIFEHELNEPRSDDIQEIAKAKVLEAYKLVQKPCIALDSGFFIESLNGFPRAFVNFALDTLKIDGILKLMEEQENRKCCFKECLAYFDGKEIRYFYGESQGTLTKEKLGKDTDKKWSELWYIFKPKNYDKTLAQMTDEERDLRTKERKDKSSSAFAEFAKWYK